MSYYKLMLEPKFGYKISELWIPIKANTKEEAIEKAQSKCLYSDFIVCPEQITEISQFEYWEILSILMNNK